MKNHNLPNRNRRPPPQGSNGQPYRNPNQNPNRPYPGNPQGRPPYPPSGRPNRPPQGGGYPPGQNRPQRPPNNGRPPQNPPPYGYNHNPYHANYNNADREFLRRQRELERRQAEARYHAERDRQRREKQRQRAERERRMKNGLKILGGRFLIFAVILVILCAVTGLLFLLFFNHTPDEPDTTGKMTYYYGGSETRKIPIEDAVLDDRAYVCFNDLADYLGMMESGSAKAMKFVLPMTEALPSTAEGDGTEESIVFHIDSYTVEINGQLIHLDIPNIIRGTEVWVSSTFLTDYINNLSCQYDERRSKIQISRLVDEENSVTGDEVEKGEEEKIVYLPVSFKLKDSSPTAPIDESVLGDPSDSEH